MSIHFPRSCAIALAGALLFVGGAAWAQQAPAAGAAQQPQGPIAAELIAVQPDWTKVCGSDPQTKKEICYTTRDFGVSGKEGESSSRCSRSPSTTPRPTIRRSSACCCRRA